VSDVIRSIEELGATARARRKQLGIPLHDAAAITGLSIGLVHDFETGKPTARIGKALQYLNALGLDILVRSR
jgi:transcriptional regulator with XRE-family HTH domain